MIRFRAWGLSAAVAVGAGAPAIAADPPPGQPAPTQTTLAAKLFGPSKPKPPGPTVRSGPVTPARPSAPPLGPDVLADALRAEQDAYLRRLNVCSELRRVGAETNNDVLIRQADELERQAAAVYNQRVAALGVPKVKAPLPDSPTTYATADPRAAAARLTAPAPPVAVTGTAEATTPAASPASPDPFREVKP
jgi:hypothetical protein